MTPGPADRDGVTELREALARSFDDLLATADALYRALDERRSSERTAHRPSAGVIEALERDLRAVTDLVDLLQSAVALSVDRVADRPRETSPS